MKKLILLQLTLLIGIFSHAQISKGLKQVGGTASYSHTINDSNTAIRGSQIRQLNILPKFGYFMNDNVAIGLLTGVTNTYQSQPNNGSLAERREIESFGFIAGTYFRYHSSISKKFYIYFQPESTLHFTTSNVSTIDHETRNIAFSFGIRPGFLFMPNDNWGFETNFGHFGYKQNNSKVNNSNDPHTRKSFGFEFGGASLQIGVQYYF